MPTSGRMFFFGFRGIRKLDHLLKRNGEVHIMRVPWGVGMVADGAAGVAGGKAMLRILMSARIFVRGVISSPGTKCEVT